MTGAKRHRAWSLIAFGAVLALGVVDTLRPPAQQVLGHMLVTTIKLYRATLSPLLPTVGVRCRFEPTCSVYAERAVQNLGAARGSLAASWRLLRCGPWTPVGTPDPPPACAAGTHRCKLKAVRRLSRRSQ